MTLGELVTTLLRESRADAGRGIWLDLDAAAAQALDAVAGAARTTPEDVLRGLVAVWLDVELAYLLERLDDTLERSPSALIELLRTRASDAAEQSVADAPILWDGLADDADAQGLVEFTVSTD